MSLLAYFKRSVTVGFAPFASNTRIIDDEVTNGNLIAGGEPTDYKLLVAIGIDTIINLTGESHEDEAREAGITTYLNFPVGELNPIHLSDVKRVIWTVRNWLKQGKKVYVHCKWGADRTGYFVACWRKWVSGWTMDVIRMELAMFASPMFNIELWPGINKRLFELEEEG